MKSKQTYIKKIFYFPMILIEQQREALESANINTTVLKTMTSGAKALKKAHNDMDADKVHDMLDEIADQQEVANQIGDAISNPVAFGQEFDEDELEASDGSVYIIFFREIDFTKIFFREIDFTFVYKS